MAHFPSPLLPTYALKPMHVQRPTLGQRIDKHAFLHITIQSNIVFTSFSSESDCLIEHFPIGVSFKGLKPLGMWLLFSLFFQLLQLLPIKFTQQNSCCINKFTVKYLQKSNWKSNPPPNYGYRICMFDDFSIGYISPPNYAHY
jgi:hypothetical protein